jgi:hypothetical protein
MKVLWSYEQRKPFLQIDAETIEEAAQLVDVYSPLAGDWSCSLTSVEEPLQQGSFGQPQGAAEAAIQSRGPSIGNSASFVHMPPVGRTVVRLSIYGELQKDKPTDVDE